MTTAKPNGKRGLGFFLTLAIGLWFTGFFAWGQTALWQNAYSDILKAPVLANQVMYGFVAIGETLIISGLFGFYLWLGYSLFAGYREVFDGLFGLKGSYPEPAPKVEDKTLATTPQFDKDIELLKIGLVSEELRNRYFTAIGAYFSILIAMVVVTFEIGIQVGSGGGFPFLVELGLLIVFPIVARITYRTIMEYRQRFSRLQPLIKNVENSKTNGDLDEILKKLRE